MKSSKKNIHLGQLLKNQVEAKGISITKLVAKAGFSRSTYYNHINDAKLPVDILLQYGEFLGVNFLELLGGYLETETRELQLHYLNNSEPETLDESKKQTSFWRSKYYELLEKYQSLLELQIKQK